MPRRVSMPAADDLFRPTVDLAAVPNPAPGSVPEEPKATKPAKPANAPKAPRRSSGRIRHDEKMTVYVTAEELIDLEHARLTLRGQHGVAVDRGRLVREAIAVVLADLEANGEESVLVRRLSAPSDAG